MIKANYAEVICPNCVAQFRAIPVNVQGELRTQADTIERLENELLAATLRIENDAVTVFNLETAMISRYDEICNLVRQSDALKSDLNAAARTAIRQELEIKELLIDAERYRAVRFQDCKITGVRHAVFDVAIDASIKETK